MDEAVHKEEKVEQNDSIDAMGSLYAVFPVNEFLKANITASSISQDGRSTFFGTTANSWVRLPETVQTPRPDYVCSIYYRCEH